MPVLPISQLKEHVLGLLKGCFFLDQNEKKQLSEKVETLDDVELRGLQSLLLENQQLLKKELSARLQKDPSGSLLKKVRTLKKTKGNAVKEKAEQTSETKLEEDMIVSLQNL